MSDFKRVPQNRGFYLNMKLNTRHGRQDQKKTFSFFLRYFKWFLWVSLSLYFFTSFLLTSSNTPTSLLKPTLSSPKITSLSRALFESSTTVLQKPRLKQAVLSQGLFNNLKIYIYDLPSKYNNDWLSNKRCSNHLFAAEVALHKALMKSEARTFNPNEADFFFVPVYVSCNFSTVNGFPSLGHARRLLASAVELISTEMPFWNRTSGSDHLFVASHDFGACFHSIEDQAIADGIPPFLKKSIILQTFGVRFRHPCQPEQNVLIPPYVAPESIRSTVDVSPVNGKRDIFVFFRGKMEIHSKNINGRFYSNGVRTRIWHKYSRNRKFYLKRERFDRYQSEIRRSVFCLCPRGWAPWSPRLVESVALGCVPVIIADGIRLPFEDKIQWPKISLTVAEKDVNKLGRILKHVAATNLSTIQKNLWDPEVRKVLLFNDKVQEGDATWQVLNSLAQKVVQRGRISSK